MLGNRYKIRISTLDGRYSDSSDRTFSIRAPAGIWIFAPNEGTFWRFGSNQLIRWNAQYLEGYLATIDLIIPDPDNPDRPMMYRIAENYDVMTKSYSWRVGDYARGSIRLTPGNHPGCKIRIIASRESSSKMDMSKEFTILVIGAK
jgi:hypothetical protein